MWQLMLPLWHYWSTVEAQHPPLEPTVIKAQLYEPSFTGQRNTVPNGLDMQALRPVLRQDAEVDLSLKAISAVYEPSNFILGNHFDPQAQAALDHQISDPVLNHYGINELVSLGVSDFKGSSRNRVRNIQAGMKKFDGIVVPQGEKFSFNTILESVDPDEGFVKEKVVLNGEGTYALGGGICQLSTTIYRAALNAGLPIDTRRGHTYAYDKYLPYGLDATIYLGAQDLVFTNDTDGDLLIKPYIEGNKLIVALYGSKDGRQVAINREVINQYYDGRLATRWNRVVTKGEEVVQDNIYSSYKAIY